jgi:maleamate amidohydrolase
MTERVWDRFLTERDKARLAARSRRPKAGFGARPALLCIDLYRSVFGDRPQPLIEAIEEWPGTCGLEAWEAIPHVQALQRSARELGIPVIHTTGLPKEESGISGVAAAHKSMDRESSEPLHKGPDLYAIIPEVAPMPGEVVIKKSSPSPFFGTPLVGYLVEHGIDTLIVVGESTSGCVRTTVVDGHTHRFRMVVAEEGVFDREEASHAMNLYDMHAKSADVLPVYEVLAWMATWGETRPATVRNVLR